MNLNGWQRIWVLMSILSTPAVTVSSVRVLGWRGAPPVTPQMAILQVQQTASRRWSEHGKYDVEKALTAARAETSEQTLTRVRGDAESESNDTRPLEQRLVDWLAHTRNVVATTGRPIPEPFTIETAEAALLKVEEDEETGGEALQAILDATDLATGVKAQVRDAYREAKTFDEFLHRFELGSLSIPESLRAQLWALKFPVVPNFLNDPLIVTGVSERERRASEAGGRMFRRSASAEGFLIELHELRAVQAVLPALQRQRVRALIVARLVFAAKGFTAWAILATTLYGLGSGVAWVRRGFAA